MRKCDTQSRYRDHSERRYTHDQKNSLGLTYLDFPKNVYQITVDKTIARNVQRFLGEICDYNLWN